MKTIFSHLPRLSINLCLILLLGFLPANNTCTVSLIAAAADSNSADNKHLPDPDADLPSRFDLRDYGVVTPVKRQSPFASCWAFAAMGASETSILSKQKFRKSDVSDPIIFSNPNALDFSEKQLLWFAYHPLEEDCPYPSQATEGQYAPTEGISLGTESDLIRLDGENAVYGYGNYSYTPISLLASGVGPSVEHGVLSYLASDGTRSKNSDWSLPQNLRFTQDAALSEANILPSPAEIDLSDFHYHYNPEGTAAIKRELLAGKGVSISLYGDDADPSTPSPTGKTYLNASGEGAPWAQYVFEGRAQGIESNHQAVIIGWDDQYETRNFFLDGSHPSPPAPGAWIVKNSWGSKSGNAEDQSDWGVPDEDGQATGYYYVSFYDHTLTTPVSYDYILSDQSDSSKIHQYDLMPASEIYCNETDRPCTMANVFQTTEREEIYDIGFLTYNEECQVQLSIYLLNENPENPTDGMLLDSIQYTARYGGYHRVPLHQGIILEAGSTFSILSSQTYTTKELRRSYETCAAIACSKDAYENHQSAFRTASYGIAVVNPGESFLYSTASGWEDWSVHIQNLQASGSLMRFYSIDNFCIKAFSRPADAGQTTSLTEPSSTSDAQLPVPEISSIHPGTNTATVHWNCTSTEIDGCEIALSKTRYMDECSFFSVFGNKAKQLELTGLSAVSPYFLTIRSFSIQNGKRIYSKASVKYGFFTEGAAEAVQLTNSGIQAGTSSIHCSWTKSSLATAYLLQYHGSGKSKKMNFQKNTTSATISGLRPGTTYTIKVYALRNSGAKHAKTYRSKASNTLKIRTASSMPAPPKSLVLQGSNRCIIVKWSKSKNTKSYEISYSTSKDLSGYTGSILSDSKTRMDAITGLSAGTTYYIRMRCIRFNKKQTIMYYGKWGKTKKATVK